MPNDEATQAQAVGVVGKVLRERRTKSIPGNVVRNMGDGR